MAALARIKARPAVRPLAWHTPPIGLGLIANTRRGQYGVRDNEGRGYGAGFSAFFQPAKGLARLPKITQPLGVFDTLEAAQAHCEQHARRRP